MTQEAVLDGEGKVNSLDGFMERELSIDLDIEASELFEIVHDFRVNNRGYLEIFDPESEKYIEVNEKILEYSLILHSDVKKFRARGICREYLLDEIEYRLSR